MDAHQDIQERLSDELKTIAAEAEELVRARGEELAERTKEIRAHLAEALKTADETLDTIESKAAAGMRAADRVIRDHPYQTIGVALGIGLALGLLLKRK
jgi:ElaB/YqjD/DUF883 family membrane-anchored ribosome-binding protein